ncbi:MAG TPA: hypothetical protein VFI91_01720 [Longimicrobiaceae bacterium]|nr:hypothetical protein [Longimicrobiaceae bacterium]
MRIPMRAAGTVLVLLAIAATANCWFDPLDRQLKREEAMQIEAPTGYTFIPCGPATNRSLVEARFGSEGGSFGTNANQLIIPPGALQDGETRFKMLDPAKGDSRIHIVPSVDFAAEANLILDIRGCAIEDMSKLAVLVYSDEPESRAPQDLAITAFTDTTITIPIGHTSTYIIASN